MKLGEADKYLVAQNIGNHIYNLVRNEYGRLGLETSVSYIHSRDLF